MRHPELPVDEINSILAAHTPAFVDLRQARTKKKPPERAANALTFGGVNLLQGQHIPAAKIKNYLHGWEMKR
ncbi:MAG: hypothetical protein IPP88_08400 [Betaproteobacteria bacterium]|nr:hypothetical protein [Betaproteobacteria bacterium]